MSRKIYWAAPLHSQEARDRNLSYVNQLRAAGHFVYLPQEHGLWEDFDDPQMARKELFRLDLMAMQEAELCIACAGDAPNPRPPSEGMLWEMGFMRGCNKTVLLFNPELAWDYNLMVEFGATMVFGDFKDILVHLQEERFR